MKIFSFLPTLARKFSQNDEENEKGNQQKNRSVRFLLYAKPRGYTTAQ